MCVEGLNRTYMSASLAVGENLGSTTMIGMPFFFAWTMRLPARGCASMAFEPQMRIRSELSTSSNGFVAAPDPKERERPATDGPWQIRAQLSTLFVLKATRAHFCMM